MQILVILNFIFYLADIQTVKDTLGIIFILAMFAVFMYFKISEDLKQAEEESKREEERRRFFKNNKQIAYDLFNQNNYFKQMPDKLKWQFVLRIMLFIESKEFVVKKMDPITFEQKAKIAFPAIQLTLGLENFTFDHFKKIILYPTKYRSINQNVYYEGEVNTKGAIVLSLENFEKGYNDYHDGINLGLHEMAHALRFNSFFRKYDNSKLNEQFVKFRLETNDEYIGLKTKISSIFRTYAQSNYEEFFAVCIENFFERPLELKAEFPQLFDEIKELLNQDTTKSNPLEQSRHVNLILKY
jgi:Mlc titration factor MtfA (ptsG expression regulator)